MVMGVGWVLSVVVKGQLGCSFLLVIGQAVFFVPSACDTILRSVPDAVLRLLVSLLGSEPVVILIGCCSSFRNEKNVGMRELLFKRLKILDGGRASTRKT